MNISAILTTVVVTTLYSTAAAQIGAQSGNTAGFSDITPSQEMTIPRPSDAGGLQAERINRASVRVKLSNNPGGSSGEYLRVMRTTGEGKWDEIRLWGPGAAPSEFIDEAFADENYKYLAQKRKPSGRYGSPSSRPTSIAHVSDVAATLKAGEKSYIPPFWLPAEGDFKVREFFPNKALDSQESVTPNPYIIEGPFAQEKSEPGFITTRKTLRATASIVTDFWIPYGFAEIQSDHPWSEFLTPGTNTPSEDSNIFYLDTDFGFYEGRWSGNPTYGYDEVSNPHWLMLPQDGVESVVQIDVSPPIGAIASHNFGLTPLGIRIESLAGNRVYSVNPGSTSLVLTHEGGPFANGVSELRPDGLRVPLKIDSRPRVDLAVQVVRLRMRSRWKGAIYTEPDADVPNPDISALSTHKRTELDVRRASECPFHSGFRDDYSR